LCSNRSIPFSERFPIRTRFDWQGFGDKVLGDVDFLRRYVEVQLQCRRGEQR